jgi:hydroxyacylglutathione hydrolase
VWPAHVGGSLCASRGASAATSSTIGSERSDNPLLSLHDAASFTAELTRCSPARPSTVDRVVRLNRHGATDRGPVRELDPSALARFACDDICLLDIRDPDSFDAAHLEGSINLPAPGRGLGTRAGWATSGEETIVLVSPSFEAGTRVAELLRAAGVWNLSGMSVADPEAWKTAGLVVRTGEALAPDRFVSRISDGGMTVIDVRDPAEWDAGHIVGSRNLPLAELGDGRGAAKALKPPIAVVCASGVRAAVAASILRRRGHDHVARVSGGVDQIARFLIPLPAGPPGGRGAPAAASAAGVRQGARKLSRGR